MDEEGQAIEVRRRRSRAEVERLVAEYETSGLGRVEFCRRSGLSLSTLARYRKQRQQTETAPEGGWVAVELGPELAIGGSSGLTVALGSGRRIEVGRGFDTRTLSQLLNVLERH